MEKLDSLQLQNISVDFIRVTAHAGMTIYDAIYDAIALAAIKQTNIVLSFNDKDYEIRPSALQSYVIDNAIASAKIKEEPVEISAMPNCEDKPKPTVSVTEKILELPQVLHLKGVTFKLQILKDDDLTLEIIYIITKVDIELAGQFFKIHKDPIFNAFYWQNPFSGDSPGVYTYFLVRKQGITCDTEFIAAIDEIKQFLLENGGVRD